MKFNKKIFICALLVLMIICCINAASAAEPLNDTLETSDAGVIALDGGSDDALSESGDTFVVDANGGGDYTTISSAVSAATGGETIFIKNGEYTETSKIDIGAKQLKFTGESQDGVIIKSGDNDLFYTTTSGYSSLVISGLTFKDISMTGARTPIFIGGDGNVNITDCTFDNCASRYGAIRIYTSGTVTIDNCKLVDTKSSTGSYSSAIDFGGSSTSEWTIKNTVIDGSSISSASTASYIFGAIYNERTSGTVTLDNVTISNCNLDKSSGLIATKGNMNIKRSKLVDNYVYRDLAIAGFIFVNGAKTVTIESSLIANNTQPNHILTANSASATFDLNYNNIQNNAFNTAFTNAENGVYTLDANYWGSNTLPEGITADTWIIENNGEYTLNNGDALEKEVPGLSPEPGANYVYASPDGTGDGSSKDTPTTLENALAIVPEGGSIFLCNGEYTLLDAIMVGKSVNFIGESRDGAKINAVNGAFLIANPTEPMDDTYFVDSVSFSKLTFTGDPAAFIQVPISMNELSITDCMMAPSNNFVAVGVSLLGEPLQTSGTLNFKKNILTSSMAPILVAGSWNAVINDNLFITLDDGADVIASATEGVIDANYNYWGSSTPATSLEIDNWVIFDATADASEIYTDESAKITMKATLNDGSDASSHLPAYPIEVMLTADGDLSQTQLALQNGFAQVTYTSDVARNDRVKVYIIAEQFVIPITVKERYTGIIYVSTAGSDDNVGSIDAPVATIGKAVELAEMGSHEIIINEGTYTGNGYHVSGDLTVTGEGKVTLDANNEGRLFFMEYGDTASKIELSNLILTNANGYGAAVYSFANELILDNVTIVNNQADGYLIKSNGKLTIKDSNITNSMSGNVIQQDASGDILINNTVFVNNSIVDTTSVMAVVNINSGSGNMVIEDSKFINNTARQGVIKGNFNYNIDVKGSEFIDNTNTVAYGGAIFSSGGTMTVVDSIFVNNKAYRSGGAIYLGYRVTANVDKCMFINNTANTMDDDYYGDAIYNGNKLTVNNSVLLGDAKNYLIYNDGEDNVVTAQNCWWGTNDNPKDLNGVGYYEDDEWEEYDCPEVDVSNWVTMDASFAPDDAQAGDEVTVTAVFSNANLPDGIEVTFGSTSGLNTVVSTVDAQASTTYTIDANDEAITATSGEATIVMPITSPVTTNIVTNDTFYNFFDESGFLLDTVTFDELIFQGEFSDLAAGYIIINRPITITGEGAVLNDLGIMIDSEDVAIDNLTLIATTSLGDLINVGASNVDLTNLIISYIVDDESANVINVAGDENKVITDVNILNNRIYFENHVTDDENLVTVINLNNVEDVIVDGNNITADYPSLLVGTYDYDYFMMGLCYVNPIRVYEAYTVELTNNNIDVTVNSYEASFPTVQALYIVGSEDILVQGNNFTMVDELTPAGTAIYLYAVECGFSEGIEFIENNFNISTTGGKSGSGSAYAIQTATSEATFIGNNITCESNGPNLGIASMYGFGPAKDLVIKDNFINVTGSATGSNEFALISGIEIQTGYATIYNNTIYVQNKGGYDDSYPVSGVSAIQYSAPTLTFDVKDNEIYVPDGKYAVEFRYAPSESTVTGNYLIAHELKGDEAVSAVGDNNVVQDNLPAEELTNIVTNDTFYKYFDANGILLDSITFDELIFEGSFSDLVDVITFNRPINVTSDKAVLENIAVKLAADDVKLSGFTIYADKEFADNNGAAIYATGSDIEISDVFVDYTAPSEAEAIGIYANAANNFKLTNSTISYVSTNPGTKHNYGLEVRNSDAAKIDNNTISAVLPAVPVSWGGEGIEQDLVLAVGIQGGNDVEFTNNCVNVNTNGEVGSYPTIDAVMVHSANNILIKGNNISHVDTTTEDSGRYYYSLDIYNTTGTVEANNILVNTTAGVDRAGTAYPIQLTGPFTVTIKDNNLTAISKGPIAGIYASNWNGAATLTVENNNIDVAGYATTGNYALVAGIEAEIDMLKAYNNTITVENAAEYDDANQVIGVGIESPYFYGDASADIKDNTIIVDGKYAVYYAKAVNTNVTGNTLYAHELEGDDAANVTGNNNVVKDNLPIKAYDGIIYVNLTGDDNNNGAIDTPVATIAKAVELAQAGSGIIIIDEGTYDSPQIIITSDLNISTVGEVVLKAQDATKKAFHIKSGDVSISNLTFTNFNASYTGSVIRVEGGSLTLDGTRFIKNGGEFRDSIVYVRNADLTMTNSVFEGNTGHKTSTSNGIINVGTGTLYVDNCNFTDNHNKYGVLYLSGSIATVYNSSFIGNNATSSSGGSGAAIYASGTATYVSSYSGNLINGSASYVLVEGCSFINNAAFGAKLYAGQGGAIYVNNNVTMFINDCIFENNTCTDNTGDTYKPSQGGAIYASAGKVIINKSIFKNNNATQGPEIYMRYYNSQLHPEEVNTLDISNSIILNDGVAIIADSTNGTYVANDNWWGTNDEPADKVVNVTVDSWAKMDAFYTPEGAYEGEINVTATFDNPNLPDGIEVTFASTSDDLNVIVPTKDAQASTTYTINPTDDAITATSGSAVIVMPIEKPLANITVAADPVWTGSNGTVSVTVPNATGTITIEVNGKSYDVELVDGVATKEITAEDLVNGENVITATYNGPDFASNNATGVLFVADGVVTQDTYLYYFNQADNGKFFDYVPEGATLDFQGSIINPDTNIVVQMNVNKPVNIISTTKDAYVDLNTTAGSLLGESPGNSFAVTNGGSGSNVTGIYFHNTQVWIANTHNVVLDNISVVVEDQRVGSGVGATSIRENSTNVILKNSYLYTRNNGGSTTFTMSWATNCTIDNCTVKAEGNVGNLIYLNIFNVPGAPSGVPLNNYNKVTNNRIYGKEGSAISVGLMVEGQYNLIENNTLYKSSISTSFGGTNPYNNTYVGNTMTDGSGLTAQAGSIIYNNNVTGALSTGKESVAYNNIVGKAMTVGASAVAYNNTAASATISGAGAIAYDNTIATTATISGKNADVENNTFGGAITISGAGVTFIGNNVTATVTVNSNDNVIKANNINTTGTYAVDLKTKTGNNVTDNLLIASELKGDSAVNSASETNIVENNYPVTSDLTITVEDITYGEDAVVTVEFNPKATGTIVVSIDGTDYTVNITSEGQGSAIISGLAANDYEVTATFTPDSIYSLDSEANASFTVFKANVTMDAAAESVKVGDDVIVNVTFDKEDVTGDVSITIDGNNYTAAIENGAATIVIPGLVAGEYAADVIYAGDENYNDAVASVSFAVDKCAVDFTKAKGHPGRVDQNATIDVILSESDATGTVYITVNGTDYSAELVDGKAVIYAPLLPAGVYNFDVIYSGDDKYENNTAPITFNVNKYYPTMKATADDVHVDENAVVSVVLPSDATGTVTITVDGIDYTGDVVDGVATVELPVIPQAGAQSFAVSYSGDDKYRVQTTTVKFNTHQINATIKATARTVKLGNDVTVNVVLPSDATGEASISVNGNVYTGAVENGAATIVIPDLGVGQYALPVEYSGDARYNPANTTVTFNVNKQTTSLKASARTVKVGDDVTVNVALASDATGEVVITIDGVDYTATVVDGAATIVIPDLPYGSYAFDVVYSGDDKYKSRTTTVTFNVNKQSTTMKATARTVKVGDDVTVNVVLASDATGEVVITIDGVDYTATVVDGVASIVIPDLPADVYSLVVKYGGDDKYKNQSTTVKFNVNKYNVRMKATAKYYADGDYSIVSVTLSDDATGTVSTSVNGNDYTTNVVDGSALIAIPKLPAGDYSLDVVYSGDAKYKDYTATTTLKVVK